MPAGIEERRRAPGRLRRAALGAGALLVGLAGAEIALRAAGAWLGRAPAAASDGEAFRILCVGDSWTQGAPDGTWPDGLIERLERRGGAARYLAVNAGLAGTNSSQALRHLPGQFAQYRPDLLLVLTGNNDHHNLTDSTYWRFQDAELDRLSVLAARSRARLHSLRVFRLGRSAWLAVGGGPTPNEFFDAARGPGERRGLIALDRPTHRRQLEYNLTRIVELARSHGVPVVLQTYFHFHGYEVNEVIRDVASRLGVPLVDHNYRFHTRIPPDQRAAYRIADGHPNARGYALMADAVLEELVRRKLVPPGADPEGTSGPGSARIGTGLLDPEGSQLLVEVAALEAQPLGGGRHLPALLLQHAEDDAPLEVGERVVQRADEGRGAAGRELGTPRERPLDVPHGDDRPPREDHQPLDEVLQLPHVAGEVVAHEPSERRLPQIASQVVLLARPAQEGRDQGRDVLTPLA